jgi:hypothetical protein
MSREMVIETLRPIARLAKETGIKEGTLSNWVRMAGVHADLAAWAMTAGRELVRSVTRELDLVPSRPKPWRLSRTEGDGQAYDIPDLVHRDFTAGPPGDKMVGDITCI